MHYTFVRFVAVLGLLAAIPFASAASAQNPAPVPPAAPAAPVSAVVANPTYTSFTIETIVNRPAAEAWARVGKYCDIGEWLRVNCTITQGRDGEVGAVRSVVNEVLVGKTEFSYTYAQPVREGRAYNMYHGTLEARPLTATTSRLIYNLMWDNSMLADDEARVRDKAARTATFTTALVNMKILAEGGVMPPAPPRGGGAAPAAPAPAVPGGRN